MNPSVLSLFDNMPQRTGGNESFAREFSRQLGERGWQSVLCFPSRPEDVVARPLESANAIIEVSPGVFQRGPGCIAPLHRLIARHRPRILHMHFMGAMEPQPWVAFLHGVRQIYFTDQGSRPEGHQRHRYPAWKRFAGRLLSLPITRVIPVSDYVLDCHRAQGILPADRLERVHNGVDMLRVASTDPGAGARFRQRFRIPADRFAVMQMCWMIPQKGVADLLEAAKIVRQVRPDVHFVLAGDGPELTRHMQQAASLDLADGVTFTGLVQDPFAEGAFRAADVFCLASRWEEAFGWVIIEAMAHGLPVIGTDAGAIPDIVRHGVTGYVVRKRCASEIAQRILELAADSEMRTRMGKAARADAVERFDIGRTVGRLLEIYGIDVQAPVSSAR